MTELSLNDLPTSTQPLGGAKASRVRRQLIRTQMTRRGLIVAAFTGASVAALTSFETFIRKIPAFAAPTAPTWGSCASYTTAAANAYGSGYSVAWWSECNPFASQHSGNVGDDGRINIGDITAAFCNSSGYHRTDQVISASGNQRHYDRRPYSCAGRNAWVWRVDLAPARPNKRSRRCSDGKVEIKSSAGVHKNWFNTVCEDRLPQHDPSGVAYDADVY